MVFTTAGGGATQETGYEISNSLRFNDGDSPSLQFTPSSDSNEQTWTVSFWVKRGVIGTSSSQMIFASDTNYDEYVFCRFCGTEVTNKADMFQVFMVEPNAREGNVRTSRLFRDPSAWYHIVVRCDLTQSTAADRLRIYVNGVKETSFDTASYLNQNDDNVNWNSNVPQAIGHQKQASSVERHLDGYLSEFYNIDGTSLGPDSFGETNDNGVWVPKQYTGSFGTNGYFLEFKQTGTSANSSGMGADTSGNDHHWTPANLASFDVTTDTPTNNFCTMNPLATGSRGDFREGNSQVQTNVQGSVPYGQVEFGTFFVNKGKWYYEAKISSVGSGGKMGLGWNERYESGNYTNSHNNIGSNGNALYSHQGDIKIGSGSDFSTGVDSYTTNDIIGCAIDLDNNKVYWHKNGNYQDDPTPTPTSNDGRSLGTATYNNTWTPWVTKDDTNNNCNVKFNFGNPPYTNSSSQSDDNGYGDFEYDVPTGFYSLCSKNLAEYG